MNIKQLTLTTTISSTLQVGILLGGYAIRCGITENGLSVNEGDLKGNIVGLNAEFNMVKGFREYEDFFAYTPYKDSTDLGDRDGYIFYGKMNIKNNGNINKDYTRFTLEME